MASNDLASAAAIAKATRTLTITSSVLAAVIVIVAAVLIAALFYAGAQVYALVGKVTSIMDKGTIAKLTTNLSKGLAEGVGSVVRDSLHGGGRK